MDILKIKAVVFDCDGVMFDTAFANRKYYDEVLHKFNKPDLTDEQFINIHMMTVKAAIGYLFPEMDDLSDVYHCLQNIGYHKFIKYMEIEKSSFGEYYALLLFATSGMMIMASAADLIVLYLGLELMALSTSKYVEIRTAEMSVSLRRGG